jgi:heterodisulfide reductase subunit C
MVEVKEAGLSVKENITQEIYTAPGGDKVHLCIQCGVCGGSCPNVNKMDYTPRQIMSMVRSGLGEEVLRSNSMWFCSSCYLCTARCPRGIEITEIMHSLESLATKYGLSTNKTTTPLMYQSFTDSIRSNGRVHEMGFMISYYLKNVLYYFGQMKTNPWAPFTLFKLVGMLPVAVNLLIHRRLVLRPKKIKGKDELKAIIDKARALGGA